MDFCYQFFMYTRFVTKLVGNLNENKTIDQFDQTTLDCACMAKKVWLATEMMIMSWKLMITNFSIIDCYKLAMYITSGF